MDEVPENNLANRPESPTLSQRILCQRAQFIAEQYGLYGNQTSEHAAARAYLHWLLNQYQGVEIALVEILVETWAQLPPPRGLAFLQQVEARLHQWHTTPQGPTLPPHHFQYITGLHPLGNSFCPLAIAHPLN